MGNCNGLFCFYYKEYCPLILCNPATRDFRKIPNDVWWHISNVAFGFGFHNSANGYELIRIVTWECFNPAGKFFVQVDIYEMGSDNWRRIEDTMPSFSGEEFDDAVEFYEIEIVDYEICGSSASAFLNGVFYWVASVSVSSEVIVVSFDMGDEVFKIIRPPHCLDGVQVRGEFPSNQFRQLKDKLCMIDYHNKRCLDVWVLDENERSWTNQFKIGSFPRIENIVSHGQFWRIKLVGFAKNGDMIFFEWPKKSSDLILMLDLMETGYGKLLLYDPKSQETKNLLAFDQVRHPHQICLYTETLVPIY